MPDGTIIVGAGHAGAQAAAALRQEGYGDPIALISSEAGLPYHRPPLSKAFLKDPAVALSPLKGESFYASNSIELVTEISVTSIDPAARTVTLGDGTTRGYDRLILATGATPRRLAVPGGDLDGVLVVRSSTDSQRLRGLMPNIKDAVIVGAGFIGLEIAATLAGLGKKVTVMELAGRVLGRAVSPLVSRHVHDRLAASGIRICLNTGVDRLEGEGKAVRALVTSAGERIAADIVIAGIGVEPDCALAEQAGLACDNGVLVDGHMRTSDPAILAIGDCARFEHWHARRSVRLESVQNATDQARLAARTIMGHEEPYRAVPWFWSDIGDMKLQMVGLSFDADRHMLSGNPAQNAFSVYHFAGPRLVAIDSINRPADHMVGRRLFAAGIEIVPEDVEAGSVAEILKSAQRGGDDAAAKPAARARAGG